MTARFSRIGVGYPHSDKLGYDWKPASRAISAADRRHRATPSSGSDRRGLNWVTKVSAFSSVRRTAFGTKVYSRP